MGYYMRGDYYRGDYYRGDFWSTIGGVVKKGLSTAVGAVKGALTGGPYGAVIGAVSNIPRFAGGGSVGPGGGGPPPPPAVSISGLPTFKGLNPFGGPPTGSGPTVPAAMMRGYHLNKSKLGPTRAHPKGAPAHTVMVRNRHMNVANPRALARASRRAHGFLRMAAKFVRYYQPKARKGRAYIGRRKRSR